MFRDINNPDDFDPYPEYGVNHTIQLEDCESVHFAQGYWGDLVVDWSCNPGYLFVKIDPDYDLNPDELMHFEDALWEYLDELG